MNQEPESITQIIWAHKWIFVLTICAIFFLSFTALYLVGFIPDEFQAESIDGYSQSNGVSTTTMKPNKPGYSGYGEDPDTAPVTPGKITIAKIGVNSVIQNPTTTSISALDEFLKNGVVHYPGSGTPTKGNMFLFAHSTSIKVVHNQAYKAFNDLDKLVAGDEVTIESEGRMYVYTVRSVAKRDEADARINLADPRHMLTLATCDTFSGIKQQRIIVEADFDHSYAL